MPVIFRQWDQKDIAVISAFIKNTERDKNRYNQKQRALIELTNKNLYIIIETHRTSNAPANISVESRVTERTTIGSKSLTERILAKAEKSLLALLAETQDLKEKIEAILVIIKKYRR
ncbi:MAG: hypothetical protein AABX05_06180 [Nanoarchaeota archaeon]